MSTPVVLFDDGVRVAPLNDLRASIDVRTGALTTRERWSRLRNDVRTGGDVSGEAEVLLVNGRCPLPPVSLEHFGPNEAIVESGTNALVMARLPGVRVGAAMKGDRSGLTTHATPEGTLIGKPWHVRSVRDRCMEMDFGFFAGTAPSAPPPGTVWLGDRGLRIGKGATVYPTVVLDTEAGMIVIEEHAVVRPGAILIGPCYVGAHATVLERATIRPRTAIGPWCKVNGEVGGTIFQGFSNKAHDGYLGDSWVGEWVNFGAGTTNSNLLNTYGEIIAKATPEGRNERTGEQFLGAIVGDHVKTAICTRIMTGSVLHTGGMFATTAPVSGTTPAFAWVTDGGTRSYRLDKFIEVAKAAMARRKVTPDDAYLAAIASLHAGAAAR